MSRFNDPVIAIEYLAESGHTENRTADKLTYEQLAEKLNVHISTIWRIRKGRTKASPMLQAALREQAEARHKRLQRRRGAQRK